MSIIEHKPAEIKAGASVQAIVPQTMEGAYRIAKAVVAAKMAPKGMDTPEACMIAIMHGMEIGLAPMTALQRIAIVNGRPTLWGDAAIGLVRGSGLCEWIKERSDGKGDDFTAICEAKRRGESEPIVGRFSVADAKRAGLWDKPGPWKQYPLRMLKMRARAFALRDGFADVLGGLYLREELEDSQRLSAPAIIDVPMQDPPPLKAPVVNASAPEAEFSDASPDEVLASLENAISGVEDKDELKEIGKIFLTHPALAVPADQSRAKAILAKRWDAL